MSIEGHIKAITSGTIPDGTVTLADMADLAADKLLGRGNGGGTGVPQAITLGTGLSMTATTLNVSAASNLDTELASLAASTGLTTSYQDLTGGAGATLPAGEYFAWLRLSEDFSGLTTTTGVTTVYDLYNSTTAAVVTNSEKVVTKLSDIAGAIVGINYSTTTLLWNFSVAASNVIYPRGKITGTKTGNLNVIGTYPNSIIFLRVT